MGLRGFLFLLNLLLVLPELWRAYSGAYLLFFVRHDILMSSFFSLDYGLCIDVSLFRFL
jgi:hypothetical protein